MALKSRSVYIYNTKLWTIALRPFKVIQKSPDEITFNGDALLLSTIDLSQNRSQIVNPRLIFGLFIFSSKTILCNDNRQRRIVSGEVPQRQLDAFWVDFPAHCLIRDTAPFRRDRAPFDPRH